MSKDYLEDFEEKYGNIYWRHEFGDVPLREMKEDLKSYFQSKLKEAYEEGHKKGLLETFLLDKQIRNEKIKKRPLTDFLI